MENFQDKANFIWQVAKDILNSTFKQHEYGDVMLSFVLRINSQFKKKWFNRLIEQHGL